jgi:drug/metabolite transporter (DMT)-like permease
MPLYYSSIILALLSSLFYHIFIKFTPVDANPMLSLVMTYLTSAILCVILLLFFPLKADLSGELRRLNWASFALALALVGLEVGFILVYRSGWNISTAALVVNVAVTILLIPIGLALFSEKLSVVNIMGILVSIAGLIMVNLK